MQIKFKKTELAKQVEVQANVDFTPVRAHVRDAGVDLRCCSLEEVHLHPGTITTVPTGLHIWVGWYAGRVEYSSSLNRGFAGLMLPKSSNPGLILRNTVGTIDEEYQGEVLMKWFNPLDSIITFVPGQRVAQLLVVPVEFATYEEVPDFDTQTTRSETGFGSTGRL